MKAELAYFFRHAILRDAAYQVQPPGTRAQIHADAFLAIEDIFNGPAPEITLTELGEIDSEPHEIDRFAADLARHAREIRAVAQGTGKILNFHKHELLYACRAARYAEKEYMRKEAKSLWLTVAELSGGLLKAEALLRAAAQIRQSGSSEIAEDFVNRALEVQLPEQEAKLIKTKASFDLASIYHRTGRIEEAKATYEESVILHQELGNKRRLTNVMCGLASLLYYNGETDAAEKVLQKALKIQREQGNRTGEGTSLGIMANIFKNSGRAEEAEKIYEKVLEINRETGDDLGEASTLLNLGCLIMELGQYDQAEASMNEALRIDRKCGNLSAEGAVLTNLATLYSNTKRKDLAERSYLDALEILHEAGHRRFEGVALGNLALIYQSSERFDEAEELFKEALAIHRSIGFKRFEGLVLCNYSYLKMEQNSVEDARELWNQGAEILAQLGDKLSLERKSKAMSDHCKDAAVMAFDVPEI